MLWSRGSGREAAMTIYDIAREAGVSASTISRVVNRKPGVNPETRQKVLDLLEKYNYAAGSAARSAARGSERQAVREIGILISDIRVIPHAQSAYYIGQELVGSGCHGDIINTGNSPEERLNAIKLLESRRAEGVITIGSTFQTEEMAEAIQTHLKHVPVVMVNGFVDLPNVVGILSDDQHGVEKCVFFLADRGHTRLAFVRNGSTPSALLKEKGFLNGMTLLLPGKSNYWTYETEASLDNGYQITERILEEHPNVEGIIFTVDILAAGGIRCLHDRKIPVPTQVAVVGVDNSVFCDVCIPRITSLDNRLLQSSVMAAHVLTDHLEGRKQATNRIMLLSEIVERETT